MSHPAVHPVEAPPPLTTENAAAAAPRVRMKDLQGMAGTPGGLVLRLFQSFFAIGAFLVMSTTSDFPSVTAFRFLVAASGLQILWSLSLAMLDIYAILVKRNFRNRRAVSLFAAGDVMVGSLTTALQVKCGCCFWILFGVVIRSNNEDVLAVACIICEGYCGIVVVEVIAASSSLSTARDFHFLKADIRYGYSLLQPQLNMLKVKQQHSGFRVLMKDINSLIKNFLSFNVSYVHRELEKITSTLIFSAACASAGITVLIGNDLQSCSKNHCAQFETSTGMAFMTWFAALPSFLLNFWSLASR
uniref:CASP-like protein n=1 Tax=Chenopodium quinoa TaxID=63459 RepID=A0A803M7U6_CHEQI